MAIIHRFEELGEAVSIAFDQEVAARSPVSYRGGTSTVGMSVTSGPLEDLGALSGVVTVLYSIMWVSQETMPGNQRAVHRGYMKTTVYSPLDGSRSLGVTCSSLVADAWDAAFEAVAELTHRGSSGPLEVGAPEGTMGFSFETDFVWHESRSLRVPPVSRVSLAIEQEAHGLAVLDLVRLNSGTWERATIGGGAATALVTAVQTSNHVVLHVAGAPRVAVHGMAVGVQYYVDTGGRPTADGSGGKQEAFLAVTSDDLVVVLNGNY